MITAQSFCVVVSFAIPHKHSDLQDPWRPPPKPPCRCGCNVHVFSVSTAKLKHDARGNLKLGNRAACRSLVVGGATPQPLQRCSRCAPADADPHGRDASFLPHRIHGESVRLQLFREAAAWSGGGASAGATESKRLMNSPLSLCAAIYRRAGLRVRAEEDF